MPPIGLRSSIGLLATFVLLTGCEEDSNSPNNGGTVTPAPVPTTPATPTPPTPPPSDPNGGLLTDLRADQKFATVSAGLRFDRRIARNEVGAATTSAPVAGTLLSYVASGKSFTFLLQNPTYSVRRSPVPEPEYGVLFDPAQRSSDPALTNARITTYQGQEADTLTLRQFNPGPGNDLLALSYAGMGVFTLQHNLNPLTHQDVRPFAFFSQVTPAGGLPQGSVTYEGVIDGFATPKNGLISSATEYLGFAYTISGTIRITVNFATGTYAGTLTVNAVQDTAPKASFNFGNVPLGQGTVSAASFSGVLNEGSLLGFFAGPNGQEMGGTLLVTIPDPSQHGIPLALVSAFVAKR